MVYWVVLTLEYFAYFYWGKRSLHVQLILLIFFTYYRRFFPTNMRSSSEYALTQFPLSEQRKMSRDGRYIDSTLKTYQQHHATIYNTAVGKTECATSEKSKTITKMSLAKKLLSWAGYFALCIYGYGLRKCKLRQKWHANFMASWSQTVQYELLRGKRRINGFPMSILNTQKQNSFPSHIFSE